jgi:hypothetical protein
MSATIPVLWSDDITVDVLSPVAILRSQTGPLSQITKGLLEAGIETITSDSGKVQLQFDLVAPVLNNFRRRILLATHQKDLVYPVVVEAECFISEDSSPILRGIARIQSPLQVTNQLLEGQRRAATDQEFIKLVGEVLRSPQVRSLIQSLIARSNDQKSISGSTSPENEESPEQTGL